MSSSTSPTLTEIAAFSRKAIRAGVIAFIALAFLTYGINQIKEYQRLHPPKNLLKPDFAFGVLPKINFPDQSATKTKFRLETANGGFPETPQSVKVFKFEIAKTVGFDPVAAATRFAAGFGFTNVEEKKAGGEMSFNDPQDLLKKMIVNVISQDFTIKTDLANSQSLISSFNLPGKEEGINFASSFLASHEIANEEFKKNEPEIFYYVIKPTGLTEKTNLPFKANLMGVAFRRADVDDKKVFTAKDTIGQITVLLNGAGDDKKIVEVDYNFHQLDEKAIALYPVITADQAWEELKAGRSYIVSDSGGEVAINSVFLAYYDELSRESLLQPVWAFEGDKNFRALVPAVSDVIKNSSN